MREHFARGGFRVRIGTLLGLLLGLSTLHAAPIGAQSLLAGVGLGVVAEPLDARARSLGGVGIGAPGWSIQPTDPAATAGLTLPSIVATFSPARATLTDGQRAGQARFPSIGLSYPFGANVFSLTLASAFDQRWDAVALRTVDLGGTEVTALDTYRSTGAVNRFQLGWARRLTESLALGVSAGSYLGAVERVFSRSLDPATAGGGVESFVAQGRWRASGMVASAGVAWDPSPLLRLSGAVAWSGDLEISPSSSQSLEVGRYPMPVEFRLGGTGALSPGLALSLGVAYANWGEVGEVLGPETTREGAWSFGGGVEWARGTLLGRTLPLRLGGRHQQLPFHFQGEPAAERVLSAGAGFDLATTSDGVSLARIELGVERGSRTAGDLSERFLRTTVSLRLSGG